MDSFAAIVMGWNLEDVRNKDLFTKQASNDNGKSERPFQHLEVSGCTAGTGVESGGHTKAIHSTMPRAVSLHCAETEDHLCMFFYIL
jgi:hypothetical protein